MQKYFITEIGSPNNEFMGLYVRFLKIHSKLRLTRGPLGKQ